MLNYTGQTKFRALTEIQRKNVDARLILHFKHNLKNYRVFKRLIDTKSKHKMIKLLNH